MVYSRDTVTGALTHVTTLSNVRNPASLAFSPDGQSVYADRFVFSRNPETGELIRVGPVQDGRGEWKLLSDLMSGVISPDGRFVYLAGDPLGDTDSLLALRRHPHGTRQVLLEARQSVSDINFGNYTNQSLDGGPRVIESSVQSNDVLAPGPLTYTATFDRQLASAHLDAADVSLVGDRHGAITPNSFHYEAASSTLTLAFDDLPAHDWYTLTLASGDGRFEDTEGYDPDGDAHWFPIPPNQSGDGIAGDDFTIRFGVDGGVIAANPFTRVAPLGSANRFGIVGTSSGSAPRLIGTTSSLTTWRFPPGNFALRHPHGRGARGSGIWSRSCVGRLGREHS